MFDFDALFQEEDRPVPAAQRRSYEVKKQEEMEGYRLGALFAVTLLLVCSFALSYFAP